MTIDQFAIVFLAVLLAPMVYILNKRPQGR